MIDCMIGIGGACMRYVMHLCIEHGYASMSMSDRAYVCTHARVRARLNACVYDYTRGVRVYMHAYMHSCGEPETHIVGHFIPGH